VTSVRIPAQAVQLHHLGPKITARALGGIACVVSASAPGSPNPGDLWINSASQYQLNQWSGSGWFPVPVNAGSLTGTNFIISSAGQFYYDSPPALTHWDFEAGLEGWTGTNATAVQSGAQPHSGTYSALLTYVSGTSWSAASPQVPVTAGAQAYASAWVRAPQALGAVGLQIAWYNSSGTLLYATSAGTAALAASTWAQLTFNATAPAGAAFVSVAVQDNETSVTGYQLYVDDVYLAGPLAVAITPSGGTDPLGNTVPPGLYTAGVYGTGLVMSTGNVLEAVPASAGVTAKGTGSGFELGVGLVGPQMTGGTAFADFASVLLFSSQLGTSGTAIGALYYTSGAGAQNLVLQWGAGGVTVRGLLTVSAGAGSPSSSLAGGIIISQADYAFTQQGNVTSPTRLCKVWTIPAGDPVTGTAYRLSFFGTGVWQGNPLAFQIAAFGQVIAPLQVGGSMMSAGTSFEYDLVATMIVSETGASGILAGSIRLNLANLGANQLPGSGANASGGFAGASSVGGVANIGSANSSMAVQVSFGASSGSQSVQSLGSVFERIGASA
jgi:hypothetical protein